MTIESEVAALTTATTGLMTAVNVQKSALDTAVSSATSSASAASGSYTSTLAINGIATAAAGTATTQASAATAAAVGASNIVLGVSTLLPTIRPSLNLDFANSKTLDPRITFSRPSPSSYTGPDGIMRYAAANVPVIDYDPITGECKGLAAWEQRTNLLTYSEDFDNVYWSKSAFSVAANSTIAPDGTMTADKLVEGLSTGSFDLYATIGFISGISYTSSFFVKSAGRDKLRIWLQSAAFGTIQSVRFDLALGTATVEGGSVTASISRVGNSWYRCSITATATATVTSIVAISLKDATGNNSYTGDGASGVYIWGAELKASAFPTPYIPSSLSFTSRVGSATYINSAGLIASAATNVERMNYNPLNLTLAPKMLLEGASTNVILNAAQTVAGGSVSVGTASGPDGAVANKFVPTAGSVNYPILGNQAAQYFNNATTSGQTQDYAFTGYFLNSGPKNYKPQIVISATDGALANMIYKLFNFDPETGVIISDYYSAGWSSVLPPTIEKMPTGMWKVTFTARFTQQSLLRTRVQSYIQCLNEASVGAYTADGVSGIQYACMQFEQGSSPTSYIPTTTAQVTRSADVHTSAATTRAADVASMTGTNFSSWYRQDEGSFVVKFSSTSKGACSVISTDDSTASNRLITYVNDNYGVGYRVVYMSTDQIAGIFMGETLANSRVSVASTYKTNDFAISGAGLSVLTDFSGDVPKSQSVLRIGSNVTGNASINGHLPSIRYYPKRLTNAELQALSAN